MEFRHYTEATLNDMLSDPRQICKDPYALLTAYLLDNLKELAEDELWGAEIPCKLVDRMVVDCSTDFKEAGLNGYTVRIQGQGFTIKRINNINWENVPYIFQFEKNGDNYVINKSGVYNIKSEFLDSYDAKREERQRNQTYFHQVMLLASQKDGWDKLTDMEAAVYCWTVWVHKYDMGHVVTQDNIKSWWGKYYDYFCLPLKEIQSCFDDNIVEQIKYTTLYPFSYRKIAEWNEKNEQESEAVKLNAKTADDYWYNLGLKKYQFKH